MISLVVSISIFGLNAMGSGGVPGLKVVQDNSRILGVMSKDFGTVEVGKTKTSVDGEFELACVVANTNYYCNSDQSTTINSIVVSSPGFYVVEDNCTGKTLYGSTICRFKVKFVPTAAISYGASIYATSPAGNSKAVSVRGVGFIPPAPPPTPPLPGGGTSVPRVEQPVCAKGSVIDVDNLVFGENIPITGTDIYLHYQSDRVLARKDLFENIQIRVPVKTGATSANVYLYEYPGPSTGPYKMTFTAGQTAPSTFTRTFSGITTANLSKLEAPELYYKISVGYSNGGAQGEYFGSFGGWQARQVGLGGWSVSVHHYWHRWDNRISYGYGGSRFVAEYPTVVGGKVAIASEDGKEIYIFDPTNARHEKTVDAVNGNNKYVFTYFGASNKLASISDAWGKTIKFNNDGYGYVTSIQAPFGQVTTIARDANGWLSKVTDPIGRSYDVVATATGLVTKFTSPGNRISNVVYNADGTMKTDSGAGGTLVDLTKTILSGGWKVDVKSALNRVDSHTVATNGSSFSRTSLAAKGTTNQVSVNPQGVSTYASPTSLFTTVDMEKDPRLKWAAPYPLTTHYSISRSRQNVTIGKSVTNSYSTVDLSLIFQTTKTNIDGDAARTWESTYTKQTRKLINKSPLGVQSSATFDTYGNIVAAVSGDGRSFGYTYDTQGRLINERNTNGVVYNLSTRTYDSAGNLASLQDAQGNLTSFAYDLVGRVTQLTTPSLQKINFTYDSADNLASVQQVGRVSHNMVYNVFNYLVSYLPPSLGGTNPAKTYAYNSDRQLIKITNPNGQVINYNYGAATGVLSSITTPNGNYTFNFNPTTGLLTSATSPYQVTSSNTYLGPLLTLDSTSYGGAAVAGLGLSYNYDFSLSGYQIVVNGSSYSTNYTYNRDQLPSKIGDQSITYEAGKNRPQFLNLGTVTEAIGYAPLGGISSVFHSVGSTNVAKATYTRRADGKVSSVTGVYGQYSIDKVYQYDSNGRLTGVKSSSGEQGNSYTYDANGNRSSATVWAFQGMQTYNSTYNAQDQILTYGNVKYAYGVNGSRATRTDSGSGEVYTYTYDAFGNLSKVVTPTKTVSYLYDSGNRRIAKLVNNVVVNWFVYIDQYRIGALLDGSKNVIATYIYGSRSNVPDYVKLASGALLKVFAEPNGTTLALTGQSGTRPYAQFYYDEFGEYGFYSPQSVPEYPFGFAGGLYDSDTKLYHFGARDYDPQAAAWIQKDPILFAGGDTNLYGYAVNDPINIIDPTGLWGMQIGVGFGGMSATAGGSFSGGLAVTYNEKAGLQIGGFLSSQWNGGLGLSAGRGVQLSFSPNACELKDLAGKSAVVGVDLPAFGASVSGSVANPTFGLSFGPSVGAAVYGGIQGTEVYPVINLNLKGLK